MDQGKLDRMKRHSDRLHRLRKVFIIVRRGFEREEAGDDAAWERVLQDLDQEEASYFAELVLLRCGCRQRREWTREAAAFIWSR